MQHSRSLAGDRRKRKMFTFLWAALLGIGTIALIYWELTALLYILATLGVSALLLIVALSDLRAGEKFSNNPPPTQ